MEYHFITSRCIANCRFAFFWTIHWNTTFYTHMRHHTHQQVYTWLQHHLQSMCHLPDKHVDLQQMNSKWRHTLRHIHKSPCHRQQSLPVVQNRGWMVLNMNKPKRDFLSKSNSTNNINLYTISCQFKAYLQYNNLSNPCLVNKCMISILKHGCHRHR